MKVISTQGQYNIFPNHVKVYDVLPVRNYILRFSKMQGFYLEEYHNFEIKVDKIYGGYTKKVEKTFRTFEVFNKNLGVLLSGEKGMGKSLFSKLLCIKSTENNYPVIVVDQYIVGLESFLDSIEQEVVILFDEFEKTFKNENIEGVNPQEKMLSLFDGTSNGKKMFIATCNNIHKLNDFLINRTGRFHYHFRFQYPDVNEVKEYLKDNLKNEYHNEIKNIIPFVSKVNLNYDCLSAIVFEINQGESFSSAIKDLNIMDYEDVRYDLVLYHGDNQYCQAKDANINLFEDEIEIEYLRNEKNEWSIFGIRFKPNEIQYSSIDNIMFVDGKNIQVIYDEDDLGETEIEKINNLKLNRLQLKKVDNKNFKYTV